MAVKISSTHWAFYWQLISFPFDDRDDCLYFTLFLASLQNRHTNLPHCHVSFILFLLNTCCQDRLLFTIPENANAYEPIFISRYCRFFTFLFILVSLSEVWSRFMINLWNDGTQYYHKTTWYLWSWVWLYYRFDWYVISLWFLPCVQAYVTDIQQHHVIGYLSISFRFYS